VGEAVTDPSDDKRFRMGWMKQLAYLAQTSVMNISRLINIVVLCLLAKAAGGNVARIRTYVFG
jgi:hypothetical protein